MEHQSYRYSGELGDHETKDATTYVKISKNSKNTKNLLYPSSGLYMGCFIA
jgi:hypothetical protein